MDDCPKVFVRLSTYLVAMLMASMAQANPINGSVTTGSVQIVQSGDTTTISQASSSAIINWQSFNIKANEQTHFQQPANGITLNRINPQQGVSHIYGELSATGKIILINAAGIHFGPSATVNVGSIIASTSDMTDVNFLAGKYVFDKPSNQAGAIINEGNIQTADYGLVALLGTGVVNSSHISARMGSIVLGAGNKFTLDFTGDQLINFTVDEEAKTVGKDQNGKALIAGIKNSGELLADGGQVEVTAHVANHVLDKAIDMDGIAEAHSTALKNGVIILSAGSGTAEVSGKLDTSFSMPKKPLFAAMLHPYRPHHKPVPPITGGIIEVLGNDVVLTATAVLEASGAAGGGNIYVGGNPHGIGPLQNAATTTVDQGATLIASALDRGTGGSIIVWSDTVTTFSGNIIAKGGVLGGDGGFSEISGFQTLNFTNATVNLNANNGMTGSITMDPENVIITADDSYSAAEGDSVLKVGDLVKLLNSANLTITTSGNGSQAGNITVSSDIRWSSGNTLRLNATHDIYLNAQVGSPFGKVICNKG